MKVLGNDINIRNDDVFCNVLGDLFSICICVCIC